MTPEAVRDLLAEAYTAALEDCRRWMPDGVDPRLAKDANGRYLLLDALVELAKLTKAA